VLKFVRGGRGERERDDLDEKKGRGREGK